jgi:hypothetical protein
LLAAWRLGRFILQDRSGMMRCLARQRQFGTFLGIRYVAKPARNLFIFQISCLGDWKKVVHEGLDLQWARLSKEARIWRYAHLGVDPRDSRALHKDSCGS